MMFPSTAAIGYGSATGMSSYGGTSTSSFYNTFPSSSSTTFGAPSYSGFGSSATAASGFSLGLSSSPLVNGPHVTGLTFNSEQSPSSGHEGGSKKAVYKKTADVVFSADKLVSISAMPDYIDKSHEELRWEDHNFNKKGGLGLNSSAVKLPFFTASQPTTSTTSSTPVQFGKTFPKSYVGMTTWNYPGPTSTSPSQPLQFSPSATTWLTTATSTQSSVTLAPLNNNNNNPFINPSASLATHTSSSSPTFAPFTITPSFLSTVTEATNSKPVSPVSSEFSLKFNQPTTWFNQPYTSAAPLNHNPFINQSTQLATHTSSSSPTFTPSFLSTVTEATNSKSVSPVSSGFSSKFNQPTTWFNQPYTSAAPLNHNPFINQTTQLATHTSSSSPTFTPSSLKWSTPITGPMSSGLSSTFNSPTTLFNQPSIQNYNGTTTGIIDQSSVSQLSLSPVTSLEKPTSVASPFGTLPPYRYIDGSQQSIQYGISSMPVKNKPVPVKYSLLTTRHVSGRIKLPVRKYDPKRNAPKIPYFSDTKEIPVATYVPWENPRALMVGPEKWPPSVMRENIHDEKLSADTYENESDDPTKEKQVWTTILDVPVKPKQPDYYTQPQISELEAKERTEEGYCRRVKDFVVGHHKYGSIKFLGETDVTKLDVETLVQFNNREVIVYPDDSKKPPVGEGLNKPAEITLLNIKCFDKKTGMQHVNGSKINKYTEMLKKKAVAQGAEFVSYDPVEGEWKFRVQHF